MGFFSRLFRSNTPAASSIAPSTVSQDSAIVSTPNTELSAAQAALALDDFSAALAHAEAVLDAEDKALRSDALQIALTAARELGQWQRVYDYSQKGFEQAPTVFHALQLALAAIQLQDLRRGEAWMEKAVEINLRRKDISPMLLRVRFVDALCQQQLFSQALPHLDWMKSLYLPFHHTDPATLGLRGWPSFADFLAQSWPVVSAALVPSQVQVWYASMLPYVDAAGQSAIRELLVARCSGIAV
ncbi:hypothetical protein [Chitinimonas taiwanensis]|uniref:Uncharacterized protein n=1 Tax=Chitinimonas taiwanensis DSM 18899 TaxID=1121279 RepID=A0A1K2HMA5_9NEIS|nr:hypothetical protein [Chitinimonas taiwanensis]SFZ77386.1 hypothetical protein SAMN02745887_02390 [Chitinimonas taiwanensis DSM 18899]